MDKANKESNFFFCFQTGLKTKGSKAKGHSLNPTANAIKITDKIVLFFIINIRARRTNGKAKTSI